MSDYVQRTLIICGTVIFIQLFGFFIAKSFWNKKQEPKFKKDVIAWGNERFVRCKSPTYPRPGTSSANALRNIKPPNNKRSTDTLEFSQEDE